jgi:hypothetical protein
MSSAGVLKGRWRITALIGFSDLSSERAPQKDKTVNLGGGICGQMSQIWA